MWESKGAWVDVKAPIKPKISAADKIAKEL